MTNSYKTVDISKESKESLIKLRNHILSNEIYVSKIVYEERVYTFKSNLHAEAFLSGYLLGMKDITYSVYLSNQIRTDKLNVIKTLREISPLGLGLKEAKHLVDNLHILTKTFIMSSKSFDRAIEIEKHLKKAGLLTILETSI